MSRTNEPDLDNTAAVPDAGARKRLLARMAGNIAAGLVREELPYADVPAQAVLIAKGILEELGL